MDVGNIQGDLHLREQLECVPERQLAFLERADASTRRLWFLWRDKTSSDVALCGCCGGCLFLDGSVERQLPKEKIQSAVYCQLFPSLHDNTLSRHLGLQPLKKALLLSKACEVDCIRSIHRGLLEHYNLRLVNTLFPVNSIVLYILACGLSQRYHICNTRNVHYLMVITQPQVWVEG